MKFLRKGKSKIKVLDTPVILDTETAWNHDENNPETWIVSIQVLFNGKYYFFQTPLELMEFYNNLIQTYDLGKYRRIVTFIHNQSYDLSYLLPYLQMCCPDMEDHHILLADSHKIINYRQGGLCFNCTYLLTQSSLETWGENMNVTHKKKVGLYDYERIIYQDAFQTFTQQDFEYAKYDVLSMSECLTKQLQAHSDTVLSVPMTHTGYIRRMLRNSCKSDKYYRERMFLNTRLDVDSYKFCANSYSGGYVHNNKWFRDIVVEPTQEFCNEYLCEDRTDWFGMHRDFRSHYPSQIRCYPLPFGRPELFYDYHDPLYRRLRKNVTIKQVLDMYPVYSTITKLYITRMELKDNKTAFPFMQCSKMFGGSFKRGVDTLEDNGRLVKLLRGHFVTYVDNHTLKILLEQYHITGMVVKVYRFENHYVPDCIAKVIDKLFKEKTDYKTAEKELEKQFGKFDNRTIDAHFNLMLAKSLLNAIYGCMATNPCKPEYDYNILNSTRATITKGVTTDTEIEEALERFYENKNSFLPYQVGCFVTALARSELYEYIRAIGEKYCVYCDTDSIFYISNPDIEKRVESLNTEKAKTAQFVIDAQGNKIQYDVFDPEPVWYAFKGLHSKCYAIIAENKKTHEKELQATISGIPARTIIDMDGETPIYLTREEEMSGITAEMKKQNHDIKIKDPLAALDNLTDNLVFYTNTGTTCDYSNIHTPYQTVIDGHVIETAGGAIIKKLAEKRVKNLDLDYDFDAELETTTIY